jgi:hypothetical protein
MPALGQAVTPRYHNPTGSLVIKPELRVTVGGDRTVVGIGVGVGYAVITGVLPGVRGMVIIDDEVGGELGLTLTLTPPLDFYLVPFAYGEVGRRFDGLGSAWLYAGGGGLYVGEPASSLGLQAGWIFRRYVYESVEIDGSGLLVALSIRL